MPLKVVKSLGKKGKECLKSFLKQGLKLSFESCDRIRDKLRNYLGGSAQYKLYKVNSDGDVSQVSDTTNGGNDSIYEMEIFNNELYFVAMSDLSAMNLYKIKPDGRHFQVSKTDGAVELTTIGNDLYYIGYNDNGLATIMRLRVLD